MAALPAVAAAAPELPAADYDQQLCVTAQRMIVNAKDVPVRVQRGSGDGFHQIQMSIDETHGELVVAMEPGSGSVACKMVNRDRVSDVLGLDLDGPERSCRDVNEHTWQLAVNSLTPAQRDRYQDAGRPLTFIDDTPVATGGEWLPAAAADYIRPDGSGIAVSAPTVQVPWDASERGFYQGTRHCKLVTLAAMQQWLTGAAFREDGVLIASDTQACPSPSSAVARAGSCLFWFAPAQAMFCQDYSGAGWTETTAREACGQRHASADDLLAAGNRHNGAGGIYRAETCELRDDAPEITATCVFNCRAEDESLWQASGPADAMMSRACDLYLPRP